MTQFLVLTFLFYAGSIIGWGLEVFWRKFFAGDNPNHRWVNPGFLHGPYLPLYGFSLCLLFALSFVDVSFVPGGEVAQKIALFCVMALCITALEYLGGLIFIKGMHIKLWDYSSNWGNVQGIICPLYTFFWWLLSAVYYFLIHPRILVWLYWFTNHLAFCLVVGFFYGVFTVDLFYTFRLAARIRQFAEEHQIEVRYERLKLAIQKKNDELKQRRHFILSFLSDGKNFADSLKDVLSSL